MHPLENLVTNSCVLLFLSLSIWLFLILLPRLLLRILGYLVMLLMRSNGNEADAVLEMVGYPANYTPTETAIALPA